MSPFICGATAQASYPVNMSSVLGALLLTIRAPTRSILQRQTSHILSLCIIFWKLQTHLRSPGFLESQIIALKPYLSTQFSMATIPISHGVLIASGTLFIPACSFVVALRFYTRRIQRVSLKTDDWLTVPALVRTSWEDFFLSFRIPFTEMMF